MKKGFTLIELLAVIVILAIIALIAVPIVLNIINDSKESSLLRSAEFYLDAVEYTIADAFLYHGGLEDKEYPITKDGDICKIELDNQGNCPKTGNVSNTLKVEVNGDKPTGGSITINGGNISSVEIVLDEKTIVKNSKGELVYLKYLDEVCTLVSGTAKTAGAKYTCKVDPDKEAYTFYVLTTPSANDTSINLIMDRNLGYTKWISESDYGTLYPYDGADMCDNESGCVLTDKGPITALNFLKDATKTWTNVNEMVIDYFYDDTGLTYNIQKYNLYARLPIYLLDDPKSEVSEYTESNAYLYDNFPDLDSDEDSDGYWTLTAYNDGGSYSRLGWYVSYLRSVEWGSLTVAQGVRPVINLKI